MNSNETEAIACCIHLSYAAGGAETVSLTEEALEEWKTLEKWQQRSCLAAAEHIPVKLAAIGCYIAKPGNPKDNIDIEKHSLTEEEIDILAPMEHDQFVAERLNGPEPWQAYEHGPAAWGRLSDAEKTSLKKQRINGTLVSWEELVKKLPQEIEKDRSQVSNIPFFLQCADLILYKRRSV